MASTPSRRPKGQTGRWRRWLPWAGLALLLAAVALVATLAGGGGEAPGDGGALSQTGAGSGGEGGLAADGGEEGQTSVSEGSDGTGSPSQGSGEGGSQEGSQDGSASGIVPSGHLDLPLRDSARRVLAGYRDCGEPVVLVRSGYLDVTGKVWGCVVEGDGWVDVCELVAAVGGGTQVHVTRMDADEWARTLPDVG